jgi:hypothetical protein
MVANWPCHRTDVALVLCPSSIDGLVGQDVNLSLDRMPSCPTYQTNIDRTLVFLAQLFKNALDHVGVDLLKLLPGAR